MSFEGKVVLITGASSGIGAATAIHFAQLGASLSITGRNVDNLNKVAEQCGQSKTFILPGDMTNENHVKNLLESTIKHYGRLDVLVNNAGILEQGTIESTSLAQYDRILNLNLRSIYQLTMLAVPHLIVTKGNIVNISSMTGLRAFPTYLAYCISKAALDQFTRVVALELGEKQVRVNAVNPGIIETNIFVRSGLSEEYVRDLYKRTSESYVLKRIGQPIDVARSIAFLASDNASFITGMTLSVDSGNALMCPI